MNAPLFAEELIHAPLQQRILLHLQRYRASFLAAISVAVLNEEERCSDSGHEAIKEAIASLIEVGEIDRLPGESVLAKTVVFIKSHQLKATDIALVWFCFMEQTRRYMVTYSELKPLFASEGSLPFHTYRHTLSEFEGVPALTRVYNCKAKKKSAREQIQKHLTQHCKGFSHWVDEGSYRLAVLVTSEARKLEIKKLIAETYRTAPPLREIAGIYVSVVPTEETYESMLKEKLDGDH